MTRKQLDSTKYPPAPSATMGELSFPDAPDLLCQINLPADVIALVLGETVSVTIFPAEPGMTRQIDPEHTQDEPAYLMDRDGLLWNEPRPVRVQFADDQGRLWRCPRYWLDAMPGAPVAAQTLDEGTIREQINLPTEWDLGDINITSSAAHRGAGKPVAIAVRMQAGLVHTSWRDSEGTQWRIPSDWRRRVVRLPDAPILAAEGVPRQIADECAIKMVAVNYHPGSLCCMPEHYRFRDGHGGKWPVRISQCELVGFGTPADQRSLLDKYPESDNTTSHNPWSFAGSLPPRKTTS